MSRPEPAKITVWISPELRNGGWQTALNQVVPSACRIVKRRPAVTTAALYFVAQDSIAALKPADMQRVILVPCLENGEILRKNAIQTYTSYPFYLESNLYARQLVLRQALQRLQERIQLVAANTRLVRLEKELNTLQTVGIRLTSEPHLDTLLELIVTKAREVMHADAGSLYLVVPKMVPGPAQPGLGDAPVELDESGPRMVESPNETELFFRVAQNESLNVPFKAFRMALDKKSIAGYVALTGEVVCINDVYKIPGDRPYTFNQSFDKSVGYRGKSMLAAPLTTHKGDIIGVLQLINKKKSFGVPFASIDAMENESLPFEKIDQDLAVALGSQAAIAVENARLYEEIQNLLKSFMHASVKAIESRDPTTSGHSERVANYTVALAREVDRISSGKLRRYRFSVRELEEIRFAGILHDFGKIGVREHVLTKARKLYPHEYKQLSDRYDFLRRGIQLRLANRKIEALMALDRPTALARFRTEEELAKADIHRLDHAFRVISEANEPAILPQTHASELEDLLSLSLEDVGGDKVALLTREEYANLSIPKGSLNDFERNEIESHVTHTYQFLRMIPWTSDLARVPDIAFGHHEKLDGSGYPRGLSAADIPVQVRMMTISDIFDALTAQDRPYKKSVPIERALNILRMERDEGKLDHDLVELFATSEVLATLFKGA